MDFWDVVWFIIISFAFVAYLMVLFSILGDLFRDSETGGFAKAVWVLALIFLPFLSALIYLVTRGRSMAERSMKEAATLQRQQEAYIRDVAGKTNPVDQVAQAKRMLDAGEITPTEYERLKEKALA
jgi:hypothetical protein